MTENNTSTFHGWSRGAADTTAATLQETHLLHVAWVCNSTPGAALGLLDPAKSLWKFLLCFSALPPCCCDIAWLNRVVKIGVASLDDHHMTAIGGACQHSCEAVTLVWLNICCCAGLLEAAGRFWLNDHVKNDLFILLVSFWNSKFRLERKKKGGAGRQQGEGGSCLHPPAARKMMKNK